LAAAPDGCSLGAAGVAGETTGASFVAMGVLLHAAKKMERAAAMTKDAFMRTFS
jgi:hypothetical protein